MRWQHTSLRGAKVKVGSALLTVDANGFVREDRIPADARLILERNTGWREIDESAPQFWEPQIKALQAALLERRRERAVAMEALDKAEIAIVKANEALEHATAQWNSAKENAGRRAAIVIAAEAVPVLAPAVEPVVVHDEAAEEDEPSVFDGAEPEKRTRRSRKV